MTADEFGYRTNNINPKLEETLDYKELKEGYDYLLVNNGELHEDFRKLIPKQKRIIFAILEYFKKYDVNFDNKDNYREMLDKLEDSNDMNDYGIGKYIGEIVDLKGVSKEDKENLKEMSDEISFFWSAKQGWTPISVDGNVEGILGYKKDEFLNGKINYSEIIHPDDLETIRKQVQFYTNTKQEHFLQSYRIKRADGQYINVRDKTKCKYDEEGNIQYYYGYIKDVTEEIDIHEQLIYLNKKLYNSNFINPKTGLKNKNKLRKDIDNMSDPLLFLFKINNFGAINSLYGFQEGNKILLNIVEELKNRLQELGLDLKLYNNNTATHFGILCDIDDTNVKNIQAIIKEVKDLLEHFCVDTDYGKQHFKFITGVAYKEDELYEKALSSLYLSKIENVEFTQYSDLLHLKNEEKTRENLHWINIVLDAIKNKSFYPVYQGIRNNQNGNIEKYEALIRLNIDGKEISPWIFLKYIDELNKNVEVTRIMLEKIIEEMKTHDKDVSINITKEDFESKRFNDYLLNLLEQNNIKPKRVILEILEDIAIEDSAFISKIIQLKEKGIRFSIDDFGNGYSNFSRLMYLEPDYIKVDGSLIKDIDQDEKKQKILYLIKKLAEINNSEIIAEYVENNEIQGILDTLGIEYSQGYLFSKPAKLQ